LKKISDGVELTRRPMTSLSGSQSLRTRNTAQEHIRVTHRSTLIN